MIYIETPEYFSEFRLKFSTDFEKEAIIEEQNNNLDAEFRLFKESLIESVEIGFTKFILLKTLEISFLILSMFFLTSILFFSVFFTVVLISHFLANKQKINFASIEPDLMLMKSVIYSETKKEDD